VNSLCSPLTTPALRAFAWLAVGRLATGLLGWRIVGLQFSGIFEPFAPSLVRDFDAET
jgi:hypothetical protein